MSSVVLSGSESGPRSERPVARVDEVYQVQLQVAKLTSDVEHIKTDISDLKTDVRRIDAKLDAFDTRLTGKIDAGDTRVGEKIDAVDARLSGKIDAVDARLGGKIDAVDARLHQFEKNVATQFGAIKIWMLGLYVGQAASLLFIMAKGFKWL